MKRINFAIPMAILWITVLSCSFSFAADAGTKEVKFSVLAVIPENQIDKEKTYFDLKMEPSQEQTVKVEVENYTDEGLRIEASVHSATTNKNGVVEYTGSDVQRDDTLQYLMEELVTCEELVTVPAGDTRLLELHIRMPEEGYEGVLAGGISFRLKEESTAKENEEEKALTIQNRYSYVIGMVLTESDTQLEPELVLNNVFPGQEDGADVLKVNIQNIMAAYANDLKIEARIIKKGTMETRGETAKAGMKMAPNSNFDFPIDLGGSALEKGDYTLYLTAAAKDRRWHWEKDFTIGTQEQEPSLEKEAPKEKSYLWIPILIAVLAAVLFSIKLYGFRKLRKMKEKCRDDVIK